MNHTAVQTVSARLGAEIAAQRLQPDGAQRAAARRLDSLLAELADTSTRVSRLRAWLIPRALPAPLRGVYLWGGVGRGKTLLMDLFVAAVEELRTPVERVHFYAFMGSVHAELATIKQHTRPLDLVAQRLSRRTRLLCLDEFMVVDIADAMILATLFSELFARGVTLVTTSNLPPRGLYRDGLQRMRFVPAIELIEHHLDVLHLDGGVDHRLRQLERAATYFDSTDSATTEAMTALFAPLAGGTAAGPRYLDIEGRPLAVVDCGRGTVWFRFDALCASPRSQNDYLELARLYQTIFISDIPSFDGTNDDAARRFVMLIDALYDRGVQIVVSAAATPAALYRGERLSFEFERAASRLVEMQTQAYLLERRHQ